MVTDLLFQVNEQNQYHGGTGGKKKQMAMEAWTKVRNAYQTKKNAEALFFLQLATPIPSIHAHSIPHRILFVLSPLM